MRGRGPTLDAQSCEGAMPHTAQAHAAWGERPPRATEDRVRGQLPNAPQRRLAPAHQRWSGTGGRSHSAFSASQQVQRL